MTKCVSMLLFALATPLACQAFIAPGSSLSASALGREGVSRSSSKVSWVAGSSGLIDRLFSRRRGNRRGKRQQATTPRGSTARVRLPVRT